MFKQRVLIALSGTLAVFSMITSPLPAVDGSLFLGTVGPVERIDGVTPGVDPYDQAAIDYVNFRPAIDGFFNSFFDATSETYSPPPTGFGSIPIPGGSEVRLYIISEEAGYSNQLGFVNGNFDLTHPDNANSLIFDQIDTIVDPAGPPVDLLRENDYVVLYDNTTGTESIDFFLIQDGADADPNDGLVERIYWTQAGLNEDGQRHAFINMGTQGIYIYYLIAFEDLNRNSNINNPQGTMPSDFPIDFTDFVGVLQIVTPEPETYALLGSFLVLAMVYRRKRSQAQA